jgi:hypothetical protein
LVEVIRCHLDGRAADAGAYLAKLDAANRELVAGLAPLLVQVSEASLSSRSTEEIARVAEQVQALIASEKSPPPIVLERLCFCRRIEMFGLYDPLPAEHEFRPGELARVYVEVRNPSSVRHEVEPGQVRWLTQLASTAEIRDVAGKTVWRHNFHRDRPDMSRSKRHDHFEHYRFCVPELPPGRYKLWIRVEDVPTKRSAQRALEFRVASGATRDS